jgi:thiamine transporter
MKTKTQERTRRLTESALLVAIGTVLSIFTVAQLPYGGSVTLASMLPVVLIAYRHGTLWGLGAGAVFGVIQQLLGLSNLSYFTTWQSIVAIILLDYVVAFAVYGLGGIFRRTALPQGTSLALGALLASLLRYICHVVSGATVWTGLSIPTAAALGYSFIYNATYMVPETVVLLLAAFHLGSVLDFGKAEVTRLARVQEQARAPFVLSLITWLLLAFAVGFDTVMVFLRLQDAETGEFNVTGLDVPQFAGSYLMAMVIVTGTALVLAGVLMIVRKYLLNREKQ